MENPLTLKPCYACVELRMMISKAGTDVEIARLREQVYLLHLRADHDKGNGWLVP